jgi:hypothetical protein
VLKGGIVKEKQRPSIPLEICIFLGVASIIAGIALLIISFSSVHTTTNLQPDRASLVLEAKRIADRLGTKDREGYGNGEWDENDHKELCKALRLPEGRVLGEIPTEALNAFVESHS